MLVAMVGSFRVMALSSGEMYASGFMLPYHTVDLSITVQQRVWRGLMTGESYKKNEVFAFDGLC